jgi:Rieske Fe-S protein
VHEDSEVCPCHAESLDRRAALKAAVGFVLGLNLAGPGHVQAANPAEARPQPGDRLVFADGDRKGEVIAPADLPPGGPRVAALPMDPATRVVRDGSRLNRLLVVRFEPDQLSEETRHRAADGVVAYSGVCTHQGCEVAVWLDETKIFWCPCHDSKFDPRDAARVVGGPAPKRLAALPLKLADGVLVVAERFSGPVGAQPH